VIERSIMWEQEARLYTLQKNDVPKAGEVLADAFQHDPAWTKLFEGASRFDHKYRAFFQTPVRYCMKFGMARATSKDLEGIVAWASGDLADMTFWRMLRSGAMKYGMRIGMKLAQRMKLVLKPLPEDRKKHMEGKPYTYLMMIGVASRYQGKGFGRRLLQAVIDESEKRGDFLYLETETEENVQIYQRFGFKTVKQIALPILDVPMWQMIREPLT
jgi:ribosomal protein S18 acetylase RimI-like enzyme